MPETQEVKLLIFVKGEEAEEFLDNVKYMAEAMVANWNEDNPNAITTFQIGGGGVQHGW